MRHSGFLEVNLSYLSENIAKVRKLVGSAELMPMLKGDAYGNGIIALTQHVVREEKIKRVGFATLGEALKLSKECPDLDSEYYVCSDTCMIDEDLRGLYADHNITPVIFCPRDLQIFLSDSRLKSVPLVIKMNTGMNRLGFTMDELETSLPLLKNRGVKHFMTHFSMSGSVMRPGDKTTRQIAAFEEGKKLLSSAGVSVEETSCSNSGAIEQKIGVNETYVRPGLMLYGPYSVSPESWDGKQISRLTARVIQTFRVKKGVPVGYGIHVAGEDGFIVVLPLGYADGISTFMSGVKLNIRGFKCSVFARVNMDMMFLHFPPEAEGKIKVGDWLDLWNHDNRVISEIADQMKTIPYALMCGITGRVPRTYKIG